MRKSVKINGEALYQIFKERELKVTGVTNELGVNQGYFANAKSRGIISEVVVVALESRYNIPRNSYTIKEESEEKQTEVLSKENTEKLYQLIYSAVYHAVKTALNK